MKTIIKRIAILAACLLSHNITHAQWERCEDPVILSGSGSYDISVCGSHVYAYEELITVPRLFYSSDNGTSWVERKKPFQERTSVHSFSEVGKYLFASSTEKGILRSEDAGETWETVTTGISELSAGDVLQFGDKLFAYSNKGLLESADTGKTWKVNDGIGSKNVFGIYTNENELYAYLTKEKIALVSADTGKSWSNILFNPIKEIKPSKVKANGNDIYILAYNDNDISFWYSGDKGKNWELRMNGLPFMDKRYIVDFIIKGNNLMIHVNSSKSNDILQGVYISTDKGISWKQRNTGLNRTYLNGDRICSNNEYAYIPIEWGQGIYRARLSDLFAITGAEDTEIEYYSYHFFAYPPRPNPSSDISRILMVWDRSFELEEAITGVCNSMGNIVEGRENMALTYTSKYEAELVWDCSRLSAGVYFIIVKHNGITDCIPVVISK